MMRKLFFSGLLSLLAGVVSAQSQEVGLFGGGAYYVGDLNPGYHFLMSKPAYGALIRYNHGSRWAFRLGGYRGKVAGSDARSNATDTRNLSFESNVTEVSVVAEFNFFDFHIGTKKNIATPFIFGGIGAFFFNPETGGVSLRGLGTEGQNAGFDGRKPYNLYSFCLPFGLGVKYSLSKRFGITAEWGLRKTLADYLDDVSRTYYLDGEQINPDDLGAMLSDPTRLHKPYMERGNPRTSDWYSFFGLSLTYKFNMFKGRGCPDQQRSR